MIETKIKMYFFKLFQMYLFHLIHMNSAKYKFRKFYWILAHFLFSHFAETHNFSIS